MIGKKIEDYLRFLTLAGETRFPIFARGSLAKLGYFVNIMGLMMTLTLIIVFKKRFGGQKFRKIEVLCFSSDLGKI